MVNSAFWYVFKPRNVGWSDYYRRNLHEGRVNCLKYLKSEWNRTKERWHKDLKKGVSLGQRVDALKGGSETTLQTMDDLILPILFILT